jgi:Cu+-exporting ATPase
MLLVLCVAVAVPVFALKFTPAPQHQRNNSTIQEWWPVMQGLSVVDLLLFSLSSIIQVSCRAQVPAPAHNVGIILAAALSHCHSLSSKVVVGYPFYKSCFKGLIHASMGMDMLIAVATTVAYLYSLAALVTNAAKGVRYELFFDSGPLLLLFITLGKLLEHITKGQTTNALSKLLSLQPSAAVLVTYEDGNILKYVM